MEKRFVNLILALLLVCALTGCNVNDMDEYDYTDIRTEIPKKEDIHIYTPGYGANGQPRDKAEIDNMLSEVAKKVTESINIVPNFYWIPYERYDEEIAKLIQSGDNIDAFTCYSPHTYVQQDLILDITDLFTQYASKYYNELMKNHIGRDYLYYGSVEGKLFMIPYYGINNPRYCIVAVKELAEKYAPDGLETMEDYGQFLKKIKENERNILPGAVNAHDFFLAFMEGNGYYSEFATYFYTHFEEPENIHSMEQTSEFMDAWRLLSQWYSEDYIEGNTGSNTFFNGKLASQLMPLRNIEYLFGQLSAIDTQFTIIPLYKESMILINTSGRGLAISKTCTAPERVVSFVEWIHESQENYDLFRYGVKDRNYTLQGDRITLPATVKPLTTWFAADYFIDIRYERITPNMDANFKEIYKDAGFKNTVTSRQINEKFIQALNENPEAFDELAREFEQIGQMLDVYFQNMEEFINSINYGYFNISPDELAEKQKKAGVDQILSFYRKNKQMMLSP